MQEKNITKKADPINVGSALRLSYWVSNDFWKKSMLLAK